MASGYMDGATIFESIFGDRTQEVIDYVKNKKM